MFSNLFRRALATHFAGQQSLAYYHRRPNFHEFSVAEFKYHIGTGQAYHQTGIDRVCVNGR